MGLDPADEDILAIRATLLRLGEHRIGLTHPRRGPEEDLEPPAAALLLLSLDTTQQRIGIRALIVHLLHRKAIFSVSQDIRRPAIP